MERLDTARAADLIESAIKEDLGTGDMTCASVISGELLTSAVLIARSEGVIAGLPLVAAVFSRVDPDVSFEALAPEGSFVRPQTLVARLRGNAKSILGGERTALNFLQRLSGIATLTRLFVQRVEGLKVTILDTRKTTPAWRYLEKYAVRAGGAENHRMGLYDQILIKGNHTAAIAEAERLSLPEAVATAISRARTLAPPETFLGVEVADLQQFRSALAQAPDLILLDNMSLDVIRRCVEMARERMVAERPLLEISGGVTLQNVRALAETGVDRISIGALTHSAPALDISLKIEEAR